jgi:hypothetical protein
MIARAAAVAQLNKHVDHVTSSVLNMPSSSAKATWVCSKHAAASKLAPMQLACCFACEIAEFETRSELMLNGAVKQLHGSALSSNAATTAHSNVMMLGMLGKTKKTLDRKHVTVLFFKPCLMR